MDLRKKQKKSWQVFQQNELLSVERREIWQILFKTGVVFGVLDYFFYRELKMGVLLLPVMVAFFLQEKTELLQKKREEIREQFVELLQLTMTYQRAGYSVENAFVDSYADMEGMFGKKSTVCRMLQRFAAGRSNHCSFGSLWRVFGEELGVAEIKDFAEVYEAAYHQSGNLTQVMEETSQMLTSKAALQKEMYLSMAARKMELQIMTMTPFAMILYIQWTTPGYFEVFYHNQTGQIVMTSVLLIYLTGYFWAYRITRLEHHASKKGECLAESYPEFVEKLRLYLAAGLTTRNAFLVLETWYAELAKTDKASRYLWKELQIACNQLRNGVSETEAYLQWGNSCQDKHYRRLAFLLSVHLKKGNRELLSCLEREVKETRTELQSRIRKKGEQASVRLLFPMMMYLIVVMILVIYPAYQRFGGM